MKAKVKGVRRRGGRIALTLSFYAPAGERTAVYRLSEDEYLASGAPEEGDTLPEEIHLAFTDLPDTHAAYERAVRILSFGDNTAAALRRKLRERGFTETQAEAAVTRLTAEGYIREEQMLLRQFAVYAAKHWGPRKYLPELLRRGFSKEQIKAAAHRADEEGIYRAADVRAELLRSASAEDEDETRALLARHGF